MAEPTKRVTKPSLTTPEGRKLLSTLTEGLQKNILGNCIFCAKAIHVAEYKEDSQGNKTVDYALQCVIYDCPGTDESIVSPVKTFLYHNKCVQEEPFRAAFLANMVSIRQDFGKINDQYISMMQAKQIKEKHKAQLTEELDKLNSNVTGSDDGPEETEGEVEESGGNA